jgi:hypothetical protein
MEARMRALKRVLTVLPCVLLMAGCASAGGGTGAGAVQGYTRDLGRLLIPTLEAARQKIWAKYNWHLYREQVEFQNVLWESEWRDFNAPEGAAVTGPTEARGRVVIRGRRVAGELDGGSQYRVTFVGEYEVRGGATTEWRPASLPEDADDVFAEVAGDMALEVRTGVRR